MGMRKEDGTWTDYAKQIVWSKAPLADPTKSDGFRFDPCKALMRWDDYGNRDSAYGWEIDHVVPEKFLEDNKVPRDLIDHIDNLRPMHWNNNIKKSDDFPKYNANQTMVGGVNYNNAYREYCINHDLINVVRKLFADYIKISQPTILCQWQVLIDRDITPTWKIPATFYDEIVTQSIHDLD